RSPSAFLSTFPGSGDTAGTSAGSTPMLTSAAPVPRPFGGAPSTGFAVPVGTGRAGAGGAAAAGPLAAGPLGAGVGAVGMVPSPPGAVSGPVGINAARPRPSPPFFA